MCILAHLLYWLPNQEWIEEHNGRNGSYVIMFQILCYLLLLE
jgi:hypothetical protein